MTTHNASRGAAFYIKRSIGMILLLALAAVFLFSGISKLWAFEPFSWQIMDAGVTNMTFAAILARTIIGLELLLGAFLVAHLFLRSFTIPAVIGILLLFTVYLVITVVKHGNVGDCGCFGESYAMTPVAGIIKNVVAAIIAIILYYIYPVKQYKNSDWIAAFAGMAAMATPFILYPLSQIDKPQVIQQTVNLEPLYASADPRNTPPDIDLRKGKHIVAFMSLTCPHCIKAAYALQIIQKQHTEFPIYLVLNGDPQRLEPFMQETRARNIPYTLFRGPEEWISMAGQSVPAIYWINNGMAERKSNIYQLDPDQMQKWLLD